MRVRCRFYSGRGLNRNGKVKISSKFDRLLTCSRKIRNATSNGFAIANKETGEMETIPIEIQISINVFVRRQIVGVQRFITDLR